jgi:hypothetical protein
MTIHTRHFHPHSIYSLASLTALEHIGNMMTLSLTIRPSVGQAGLGLMTAAQTGNWFTAECAALYALDELEQAGLMYTAGLIRRAVREGNERIVAPYQHELSQRKVA